MSAWKKDVEVRAHATSLPRTHEALHLSAKTETTASGESSSGSETGAPEVAARPSKEKVTGSKPADTGTEKRAALPGTYHVDLPTFEGPLDLLLHLIQKHELDIKEIPILFVSEKYVEYMMLMQDLNIDLASEYLVMAATLAHIKSKMLLPKAPVDQEDEDEDDIDPRGELVRRLLEYQKYKNAARQLGESPVLGRDVFLRGAAAPTMDGPAPLAQVGVFKLFDAFQRLLSRTKQKAEHLIDVDRISISARILELTDILRGRGKMPFLELFTGETGRDDLIVSFLAVLEMTRLRMLKVTQEDATDELLIELTITAEHDDFLKDAARSEEDPLDALARGESLSASLRGKRSPPSALAPPSSPGVSRKESVPTSPAPDEAQGVATTTEQEKGGLEDESPQSTGELDDTFGRNVVITPDLDEDPNRVDTSKHGELTEGATSPLKEELSGEADSSENELAPSESD